MVDIKWVMDNINKNILSYGGIIISYGSRFKKDY